MRIEKLIKLLVMARISHEMLAELLKKKIFSVTNDFIFNSVGKVRRMLVNCNREGLEWEYLIKINGLKLQFGNFSVRFMQI